MALEDLIACSKRPAELRVAVSQGQFNNDIIVKTPAHLLRQVQVGFRSYKHAGDMV
jgi:hypothetical protein